MTLLLPLVMLGIAVAADQPQTSTNNQTPAVSTLRTGFVAGSRAQRSFTVSQSENPLLREDQGAKASSSAAQDEVRNQTCFTMRSYFFERDDDLGMQFLGMTKCDPGRAVTQKHVRGVPRLLPAK